MVEILKHGDKNIIECDFCGALLKYSVEDIKRYEDFIFQRKSEIKKYIECPDCNNKVFFQERIKK